MVCCGTFVGWDNLPTGDQATWVLAILTLLYFVVTIFLWLTARDALREAIKSQNESTKLFDLLNTPWLDITEILMERLGSSYTHDLTISYMNFGNIPAQVVDAKIELKYNDVLIRDPNSNPFDTVIVPKHLKEYKMRLEPEQWTRYANPSRPLTLDIKISYKGAGNEIKIYERKSTFNYNRGLFVDTVPPQHNYENTESRNSDEAHT
jgi:hypothetical protein